MRLKEGMGEARGRINGNKEERKKFVSRRLYLERASRKEGVNDALLIIGMRFLEVQDG